MIILNYVLKFTTTRKIYFACFFIFTQNLFCIGQPTPSTHAVHWSSLPNLPDAEGFASPFAGAAGGALLVAGGANFPNKRPWDGGHKVWYDTIYALTSPEGTWSIAGQLPRSTAYGVSVNFGDKLICVGGGNAKEHFRDVYALNWNGKVISFQALPPLPRTCAFMSGAVAGNTLFILGGKENPGSIEALKTFWSLDLVTIGAQWCELEPCPGPGREQAVMATIDNTIYVISGITLVAHKDGKADRNYLRDAYAYTRAQGWRRLADPPRAIAGALSPAPIDRRGRVIIISGDDGTKRHLDGPHHPGFPLDIFAYDPQSNRWGNIGEAPFSMADVPSTFWRGDWVAVSGEIRPGYRSNRVWSLHFSN